MIDSISVTGDSHCRGLTQPQLALRVRDIALRKFNPRERDIRVPINQMTHGQPRGGPLVRRRTRPAASTAQDLLITHLQPVLLTVKSSILRCHRAFFALTIGGMHDQA